MGARRSAMPGVQNQSGVYGEKKSDLGFTARPPTRQSSPTNYPLRRSSGLDNLPESGLSCMYPSISGNECGAVGSTYIPWRSKTSKTSNQHHDLFWATPLSLHLRKIRRMRSRINAPMRVWFSLSIFRASRLGGINNWESYFL